MPIVIGVDSYATVAEADAYHTNMGAADWVGVTAAKEAALRRATQWVDGRYRRRFPGHRTLGRTQALEWPRSGLGYSYYGVDTIAVDAIPIEVKSATMEAALREIVTPFSLSPDFVASQSVKREKVDVLETEYAGAMTASSVMPILANVDAIMAGLLGVHSAYSVPVLRV